MKKRCGIAAAMILLFCTACGESSVIPFEKRPIQYKTAPQTTTAAFDGTEPEAVTTDELDRRIGVIYDLQPVEIPAEGWSDATLLPTVCIGGECGKLPFCLADLLYGYALTGEHAAYYTEHAAKIFSHDIDFAGTQCWVHNAYGEIDFPPRVETHDPALPEGADDHELMLDAEWCVVTENGENRMSVSVNCVTIGTSFEDVKQRIGFSEEDRAPGEDADFPRFLVHCRTQSLNIIFMGEDTVDTIILRESNE